MTITYTTGDATAPTGPSSQKVIAHVCNDEGKWGSGFVVALSRRNRTPENAYRQWHRDRVNGAAPFALGEMQMVNYTDGVWVANMIAQRGIRHDPTAPPAVRYAALEQALNKVANYIRLSFTTPDVHMPRIGCGLGGGRWETVEYIINNTLVSRGIAVTVYDMPSRGD